MIAYRNAMDNKTMPTLDEVFEFYREQVESLTGPKDSAMPTLIVGGPEKLTFCALSVDVAIAKALRRVIASIIVEQGRPNYLVVCSEAWSTTEAVRGRVLPSLKEGELQERARAGDESVSETVMIYGMHFNRSTIAGNFPFSRASGQVVWGEPTIETFTDGRIPDVFRAALRPNPFMHPN